MYAAHESGNVSHGVDIESEEDGIVDSRSAGILDCLVTKQHAVKLAVDAVNTILSIDQIIMSRPAGGPKPPKQENWDED